MIHGIDHIVVVVADLETAIAGYVDMGFTVVRGGRHSGLNTHNALIAFGDGCYFELIAFLGAGPAEHWWYQALQDGGGLTDFCVQTDNLELDAAAFRNAGAAIGMPFAMGRERPDGYRINWELAVNDGDTRGLVPFLIRDLTPRDERVPHERTHRNQATGVQSLAFAVAELGPICAIYEKALGRRGETIERADVDGAGVRFALGPHELQLIAPQKSSGLVAERLRSRGPSPLEVKLTGSDAHRGVVDLTRAHGARILIS
jgi:catechol 2,3-dioxygenase-like lactoylglutathione lyase family enzyme